LKNLSEGEKTPSNKWKVTLVIVLVVATLLSITVYYALFASASFSGRDPQEIKLKVEVYDSRTGEPLEGVTC